MRVELPVIFHSHGVRVYGLSAYHARRLAAQPGLVVGYRGLPATTTREAVRQLTAALAECGEPCRRPRP
jgi:hypothetical protein